MTPVLAVAETIAQSPPLREVLANLAFYLGVAALIGASVVALGPFREGPPRALGRIAAGAWLLAALAVIAIAEIRREALALAVGPFLGTPLGLATLLRAVPLLIAHEGVVLAVAASGRARRAGYAMAGGGAAAAAYGHVTTSHASIGTTWFEMPLQWVHIVGMSAWIGGLVALLLVMRGEPDDVRARAVRRFSTIAGVAIVVVVTTGVLRAVSEVGGWNALVSTTYGRIVLLKSQLLLAIAILGSVNRSRSVPLAGRTLQPLRRLGSAEVAIAVVVLALTGVLSGTQTAAEADALASRVDQVLTVDRPPFGGPRTYTMAVEDGRSIQVYLDPERAGRNEIHVTYFGADGREAAVASLSATLERGETHRPAEARRFSPGHFIVDATLRAGRWTLIVEARFEGGTLRSEFPVRVPAR